MRPWEETIQTVAELRARLADLPGEMQVHVISEGCWASLGRVVVEEGVACLYVRYQKTADELGWKAP